MPSPPQHRRANGAIVILYDLHHQSRFSAQKVLVLAGPHILRKTPCGNRALNKAFFIRVSTITFLLGFHPE